MGLVLLSAPLMPLEIQDMHKIQEIFHLGYKEYCSHFHPSAQQALSLLPGGAQRTLD